jgi:hypothetical protein
MTRNLDDDQQTDVCIMELSKAFDKVSHNFLTHKLKHYGIRGKVNNWIESFLSGRTQAVIDNPYKYCHLQWEIIHTLLNCDNIFFVHVLYVFSLVLFCLLMIVQCLDFKSIKLLLLLLSVLLIKCFSHVLIKC